MNAAIPARLMPQVGAMIPIQGTPQTFEPNPFMVHMDQGTLVQVKGSTPPATKGTTKGAPTKKGATKSGASKSSASKSSAAKKATPPQ